MNSAKVELLTIGQSPRDDVVPEIRSILLPHVEITETGLLDYLSVEEIKSLQPESGETSLVSRLRDGRQVQLSEQKIISLYPKAIESIKRKMDVSVVGILCTHDFSKTKFSIPVIFPFEYLNFLINQILNIKSLGVLIPLENQIGMAKKKWKKEKTILEVKSPYAEGKTWKEIAQRFSQEKVEAVILDCIGYKIKDKHDLQSLISIPILLPRVVLAFAINQLF